MSIGDNLKKSLTVFKWTFPSLMLATWSMFLITSITDAASNQDYFSSELNAYRKFNPLGHIPEHTLTGAAGLAGITFASIYGFLLTFVFFLCMSSRRGNSQQNVEASVANADLEGGGVSKEKDSESLVPAEEVSEPMLKISSLNNEETALLIQRPSQSEKNCENLKTAGKIFYIGTSILVTATAAVFFGLQIYDEIKNRNRELPDRLLPRSLNGFHHYLGAQAGDLVKNNLAAAATVVSAQVSIGISLFSSILYLVLPRMWNGCIKPCWNARGSFMRQNTFQEQVDTARQDLRDQYSMLNTDFRTPEKNLLGVTPQKS